MHGAFKESACSQPRFGVGPARRIFGPFNWHNLAFDPFNLSPCSHSPASGWRWVISRWPGCEHEFGRLAVRTFARRDAPRFCLCVN